jgi:N-methylhydantoinase A
MTRILVPRNPGILCATGLLLTDLRADFATTRPQVLSKGSLQDVADAFADLATRADAWFAEEGIAPASRRVTRTIDMRYAGQNYELPVAVPEGKVTAATLDAVAASFAKEHARMYGFAAEGDPVQLITFRVEATGVVRKAEFQARPEKGADASAAIVGKREVWMPGAEGFVSCPIYDRAKLDAGNRILGPAIVEQMDATTVIPPGMIGRVEPYLNLILEAS